MPIAIPSKKEQPLSKDYQIAFRCPHDIVEERVGLGADRQSLPIRAPIATAGFVRVLANDEFFIPSSGLYSQAVLTGATSGPFSITDCTRQDLIIQGSAESHSFTLPLGNRITADALVALFRQSLDTIVVQNIKGHLVFTDIANVGRQSRLRIRGRAGPLVGFAQQKGAQGAQIYPAWTLAHRTDILPVVGRNGQVLGEARYPKFREQVRLNPIFKVSYSAPVERCPRCGATFVENDFRFTEVGDPLFIENENLLYQAALKAILTDRASNPYHPSYGTSINSRIGLKAIGATATILNEDVRTALSNMQNQQAAQAKYQRVTARERLFSVSSVNVFPDPNDPTVYRVNVVVTNASNEPIQLSVVFTVPGAIALVGTNGLSLGLDTTGLSPKQSRSVFN